MALVTWDASYSVKVRKCDFQHQKLFSLINSLHDAMKSGQGRKLLGDIVRDLEDYTQTHFREEEELLQRAQYPQLNTHRVQHQQFVAQVQKLRSDLASGSGADPIPVLTFLKDWLAKHIKQTDKLYTEHLNSQGIH